MIHFKIPRACKGFNILEGSLPLDLENIVGACWGASIGFLKYWGGLCLKNFRISVSQLQTQV